VSESPAEVTVLVVDDDPSMRRTLAELIAAHGYGVTTSSTAEEALEVLQESPADLLVTDLRMPGMKGEELVREVRRLLPYIPVIAITAGIVEEHGGELSLAPRAEGGLRVQIDLPLLHPTRDPAP